MRAPSLRNAHGFTMLELMIAVLVMGVVVALSVPTIRGFNDTLQLKGATSTLESNLRKARSVAITRESNTLAIINPDTGWFAVVRDQGGDENFDTWVSSGLITDAIDLSSIDFNGENFVVFDSRGRPSNPGRIQLASALGSAREIRVSAGSGAISVREPAAAGAGN